MKTRSMKAKLIQDYGNTITRYRAKKHTRLVKTRRDAMKPSMCLILTPMEYEAV